ncbi:hypothetical protein TanjilG_00221 [Lupinus angustifolius]|uniref:WRKY domain-containing protein n=1 Tax=Lupinus angustifolius TaxID=3871 RepID=A0A394D214_LUPAN|nr:PREDICTED: WRKY transcription factor WRKY24-like [Lupinus angustifolius]OIW17600.1 hypothetical protein TanjilG_00221 [Lupinus angustifolius]
MMDEDKNNKENRNKGIMGCSDSKGGDFQTKRSIAERRGFSSNAAKINTSRFRTMTTPTSSSLNPLGSSCPSLAACRSPCLTIPPGISPTALLDSPIMLPNSQAMPSPTTGTYFQLPMFTNQQTMMSNEQGKVDDLRTVTDAAVASFKFKPRATHVDPKSLSHFSTSLNQVSSDCNMMKGRNSNSQHVQVQQSVDFSVNTDFPKRYDFGAHLYNDVKMVDDANVNASNSDMLMSHSEEASDESTQPKNVLEGDQKETSHATGIERSSEDGYNWRKYGQKQVKGCEYPRSYYKCTQPNCLVKKKVERSHDGQITAIIYKGSHNHLKPHNLHRASALSNDEMLDMGEANESGVNVDGGLVWRNIQSSIRNSQHGLDWNSDFQERASSDSTGTQLSDPISTSKAKSISMLESEDTAEFSSRVASHDGNEDGTTQTPASLEDDAEHIESQSKRRKKESSLVESNLPPRALREPRVVIQIETEVDILDDGYRWRKYGQKVVKGNPNPRSYYKCTSTGCPVRKHVERASHNIKYVLTTYEGKHNHGVPTARHSNHFRSSDGRLPPGGANGQMALTLTRNGSTPNPETQVQSLAPHFDRKPEIGNEFLRSNLVGSFSNDMKFGPSSMYQMKYPSLNNTMPYGSYGLNHDRLAGPQGGPLSSVFPDFSMPSNLPSSSVNFSMNGINFNRVKPMGPVHQSFHSGQHVKEIESGFIRPKQEQKDDMMYGTCLPTVDHANASNASSSASPSIYKRAMQNFPA